MGKRQNRLGFSVKRGSASCLDSTGKIFASRLIDVTAGLEVVGVLLPEDEQAEPPLSARLCCASGVLVSLASDSELSSKA